MILFVRIFTCALSKFLFFKFEHEYINYYKKRNGHAPSTSTLFWSARGVYDIGFYLRKLEDRDFKERLFFSQMALVTTIATLTFSFWYLVTKS